MTDRMTRFVKTIRRNLDWVVFSLPDGQKIRVLVRDQATGNPRQASLVIECPKKIRITTEDNDNIGNN